MAKTGALALIISITLVAAANALPPAVPELDPSSASMGLALLAGGLLLLSGRRSKR